MRDFVDRIWLAAAEEAAAEIERRADLLRDFEQIGVVMHLFDNRPDGTLFHVLSQKNQNDCFDFNFYMGTAAGPTVGIEIRKAEMHVRLGGSARRLSLEGEASTLAARLREIGRQAFSRAKTEA